MDFVNSGEMKIVCALSFYHRLTGNFSFSTDNLFINRTWRKAGNKKPITSTLLRKNTIMQVVDAYLIIVDDLMLHSC